MSWYFLTQHNMTYMYMHTHVYYTASSSFLLPLFFPPSSFSAIFPYTVPFCLLRIKIIKYLYNMSYTYMYFLYQYKHSHTHYDSQIHVHLHVLIVNIYTGQVCAHLSSVFMVGTGEFFCIVLN